MEDLNPAQHSGVKWTLREMGEQAWRLGRDYLRSSYQSLLYQRRLKDIESFCMFIGYPRSGHSLIGALLDAHPNIIVAHELDVLRYVKAGFSRGQLYALLLDNSRAAAAAGRISSGYSYAVKGQWQGKFERLKVIGDKQGGGSTLRLAANPRLLDRLRDRLKSRIKLIHVVRNPYDNISTLVKRGHVIRGKEFPLTFQDSIELYFSLCATVKELKNQIDSADLFEMRHESLIADPRSVLNELCSFLAVAAPEDYLNDCASLVFTSPHRTRYDASWSGESMNEVKEQIDRFDFLKGYTFEV